MLLTKKQSGPSGASSSSFVHSLRRGLSQALPTLDRRSFLRRSGLGVGVGLAATQLSLVKKAQAASGASAVGAGKVEVKRTVCTHCSVGCAVDAVVENGVWVRQEPVFDSPINLGAHCAKGAAVPCGLPMGMAVKLASKDVSPALTVTSPSAPVVGCAPPVPA